MSHCPIRIMEACNNNDSNSSTLRKDKKLHERGNNDHNSSGGEEQDEKDDSCCGHPVHGPTKRSKHQQPQNHGHSSVVFAGLSSSYQGYTFPKRKSAPSGGDDGDDIDEQPPQLDRVKASSLLAAKEGAILFFRDYVAARRPCIIEDWPNELDGAGLVSCYDRIVQHLLQSPVVATTQIAVEERDSLRDRFGQGRRVNLSVQEFWQTKLATQRYYLSTQPPPATAASKDTKIDDDQQQPPAPFYGPPCQHLREAQLLPNLSRLTGNLQLSSCNLWVGCCGSEDDDDDNADGMNVNNSSNATNQTTTRSSNGTSSTSTGLHHDFHDNFYCLLAGRKRFYLYAPTEACGLGIVNATLHHGNGLLSYQPNTRADGRVMPSRRPKEDDIAKTTTTAATDATAGAGVEQNNMTTRRRPYTPPDDNDNGEGEVVWGRGFDYQSSSDEDDAYDIAMGAARDEEEDSEEEDDNKNNNDDGIDDDDDSDNDELPKHFSWIDPTAASKEIIARTFPAFAHTTECIVELQPGEILYLPASWFHCVTSMAGDSDNDSSSSSLSSRQPKGVHMAVNYWFHPPDNLNDFEHPYLDREYWEQSNKEVIHQAV